jgi:hypothetical protein
MAPTAFVSDLALGIAEKVNAAFAAGQVEQLQADEFAASSATCRFLRDLFEKARRSIEATLSAGVDARAFAAHYGGAVAGLDGMLQTVERIVAHAQDRQLSQAAGQFLADYQELGRAMADLRGLLVEALAKAGAPTRPVDWDRIRAAEAAHARGETKPFQRTASRPQGA